MLDVHFKRHGCGEWLELQRLRKCDSPHCYTYIDLNCNPQYGQYILKMEHVCSGHVLLSKTIKGKYKAQKANGFLNKTLEKHISNFLGEQVSLGRYVESYHWGNTEFDTKLHPEDKHMLQMKNGNYIDIGDMSTRLVLPMLEADTLTEFFEDWKVERFPEVFALLREPSEEILEMNFVDLYSLIHNGCHKKDFQSVFINTVKSICRGGEVCIQEKRLTDGIS